MPTQSASLKRSLSMPAMVFYGLGTIVGAGIYVLIGKITGEAGAWTPLAFLIAAVIAGFTGLSYAELVSRHPWSGGEAVYIEQAFHKPWLTQWVGWAVVFTGLVSASTLIKGFAGYFIYLLTGNEPTVIIVTIVCIGCLACIGVKATVSVAVTITLLELIGLSLVILVSGKSLLDPSKWSIWQQQLVTIEWQGVAAATFLAFYAFIGFEDMVNMAEEVKEVSVALPKAIIISLILATALYIFVSLTAVIAFPPSELANSPAPLATMTEHSTWLSPKVLAAISLIAIVNGVIVQLLMAPRVIYGITASSRFLKPLARINPITQTPINATILTSLLIMLFSLALPLKQLAQTTSGIILCLFALVNVALLVLKKRERNCVSFQVPTVVPVIGFVSSLLLLLIQFISFF